MLHLWMPEAQGLWQWSIGGDWSQASSLEQLIQDIQQYSGEETVVYFPSRHIQLLQQSFTKAQYKQLGVEGIKYLLEEYVLSPIDQMKVLHHFQAPNQLTVMGIAQSTVETLQHSLNLLPIKPVALLPDFLVLPEPKAGEVVIGNFQQHLLVREQAFKGNSIDDLALFLEFQPAEMQYQYANLTDEQFAALSSRTTQEHYQCFDYQFQPISKPKTHPWNILSQANKKSGVSGYWKACTAVLLAGLLVQFSYDLVRWVQLKKVADQTATQAIEQYKSWFGAQSRVTEKNIKSQFESHLRMNQSVNSNALHLLSRVGPVLMQQNMVADRVSYDGMDLNLELKAKSADVLQNLVKQFNQQGFKAELGNIQPHSTGVLGLVKVQ